MANPTLTPKWFLAPCLWTLVASVALAGPPRRYVIEAMPILETPPECSPNSNAIAINERGDVIGVTETARLDGSNCRYEARAVIWRDGMLFDLGGIPPNTDWGGSGKGINDTGDAAVGWAPIELAGGGGTGGAFFWKDGEGMSLIDDGNPFPSGEAWGVNNSYEVAVSYRDKAYYWNPDEGLRAIAFSDTPDSNSYAWEINNSGVVVGASRRTSANSFLHAYKYDSATGSITDLHDPDVIAYDAQSIAYGINDDGDIVGMIEGPEGEYASIWLEGQSRFDLPVRALGPNYVWSRAEHLNAHHDVVGVDISAAAEPPLAWAAFEVSPGNTARVALVDLLSAADAAAWTLTTALEINDARQIVGIGVFNGRTRGYLMTPADPGSVPDGTVDSVPLLVSKDAVVSGVYDLSWDASCASAAVDYSIHEGEIGDWYGHDGLVCTTGGALAVDNLATSRGSRYYLVVPLSLTLEGGYGRNSFGEQRPASAAPCLPEQVAGSCP